MPRSVTKSQVEKGRKSTRSIKETQPEAVNASTSNEDNLLPTPPPLSENTPRKPATNRRSSVIAPRDASKRGDNVKKMPQRRRGRRNTAPSINVYIFQFNDTITAINDPILVVITIVTRKAILGLKYVQITAKAVKKR